MDVWGTALFPDDFGTHAALVVMTRHTSFHWFQVSIRALTVGCCLLLSVVVNKLSTVPGISSVHEVHIWELISGKIIATLHIKCQKDMEYEDASRKIREIFHHAGIHNLTIQFETLDLRETPEQKDFLLTCSAPCISQNCAKKLCCPPGTLPLALVNGCAEHNGGPPLETYRSTMVASEAVIDMALDGCPREQGQTLSKTWEGQYHENSTHF